MTTTVDQLHVWLDAKENEHLEFKEAKNRFDFEELVKYCAALANEGGGRMILGVTDQLPRRIVGSQAFTDLERTKAGLIERLRLRIDTDEIQHLDEGHIHNTGYTKAARWYPGPASARIASKHKKKQF